MHIRISCRVCLVMCAGVHFIDCTFLLRFLRVVRRAAWGRRAIVGERVVCFAEMNRCFLLVDGRARCFYHCLPRTGCSSPTTIRYSGLQPRRKPPL